MLSATALLLCVSAAYTAEPRDVAKQIDQHLARPLADKKMPTSPVAADAEFVRRVSEGFRVAIHCPGSQ